MEVRLFNDELSSRRIRSILGGICVPGIIGVVGLIRAHRWPEKYSAELVLVLCFRVREFCSARGVSTVSASQASVHMDIICLLRSGSLVRLLTSGSCLLKMFLLERIDQHEGWQVPESETDRKIVVFLLKASTHESSATIRTSFGGDLRG